MHRGGSGKDMAKGAIWKSEMVLEVVVAALEASLRPGASIEVRKKLVDSSTGRLREVDVFVIHEVAGEIQKVGIECRHHKRKVGVAYLEQMVTKKKDLGLDRLHVVSASGFTRGAVLKARNHRIVLSRVEEVARDGWGRWLAGFGGVQSRAFLSVIRQVRFYRDGVVDPIWRYDPGPKERAGDFQLFDSQGTPATTVSALLQKGIDEAVAIGAIEMPEKSGVIRDDVPVRLEGGGLFLRRAYPVDSGTPRRVASLHAHHSSTP